MFFAEVKCRLLQNRPWGLHPQTPVKSTDAANQNLHLPHPLILQLPTKGGCNFLYFTLAINSIIKITCFIAKLNKLFGVMHYNNRSLCSINLSFVIYTSIIIIFFDVVVLFFWKSNFTLIHYFCKVGNTCIKQF